MSKMFYILFEIYITYPTFPIPYPDFERVFVNGDQCDHYLNKITPGDRLFPPFLKCLLT